VRIVHELMELLFGFGHNGIGVIVTSEVGALLVQKCSEQHAPWSCPMGREE
jgi:hypothetical protein